MAILRVIPRKARHPALSGRMVIDTVRGVLRVRKWPKKRGPPKSERQAWWVDWFRQANALAKYVDPRQQEAAIVMTKGTGMYPRDLLLKAMRGRLYHWADETGWRWFSMAAITDISNTLDVLAQTVGSVLVRATDRWRAPAPGVVDDVLTLKGSPLVPVWYAAGGGAPAFGGALVNKTADQTISNVTMTPIVFDGEVYDTDAIHDPATNPSRLTVPAGWSKVRLTASVRWQSNNSGNRILLFWHNGTYFPGQSMHRKLGRENSEDAIASPVIEVTPADYFEAVVWHSRGSNLNVNGLADYVTFAMERVA